MNGFRYAIVVGALALVCLWCTPASAENHFISINEVYSNEDGSIQFVELIADASGQTDLEPMELIALDETGEDESLIFDFTASFTWSAGETILLATADAEVEFDVTADFVIDDESVPIDGRVIFRNDSSLAIVDAVAYGAFDGSNSGFGDPAPALPLTACQSLTRTDGGSDNDTDFTIEIATPQPNDEDETEAECPSLPPFSMRIVEVFSDADGLVQYVMLHNDELFETDFSSILMINLDADGAELDTFLFPATIDELVLGGTIVIATDGLETEVGVVPDLELDADSVALGSGRIQLLLDEPCDIDGAPADCVIDAVAYGDFKGDNGDFGDPATALPEDGCTALTRISDTDDNATDFEEALAAPENLAGDLGKVECPPTFTEFIRGDVNGNGSLSLADGIGILFFIFVEDQEITCEEAGDANNSDTLSLADGLVILNFVFVEDSAPPPAPYPDCGEDDTNTLGCDFHETCAP